MGRLQRCMKPVITTEEFLMEGTEESFYRTVINTLKTALMDLDYCFASREAKEALENAIAICEQDLAGKLRDES